MFASSSQKINQKGTVFFIKKSVKKAIQLSATQSIEITQFFNFRKNLATDRAR